MKDLKDATANLWYVYSQTKNSADTITRLKNYKMQPQRALQDTTAGTTKDTIARLKN
jgi:hypothetical protein